ncbi:MAG: hypothetical protein NDI69_17030 [Bacteriovoracaceae bacterium]|nr:hypothetical protein [Bacteriovoracaceae bacterium]
MLTNKKMAAMVLGLSLSGSALTCTIDGQGNGGFLPENNLYISANQKSINGISEQEFNEAIDEVETVYAPIIAGMGAKLEINRNWDDGTVNAYAQQNGKTWKVAMFGGLARHKTITKDAMALVVCHEVGHHIGGAPRKGQSTGGGGGWWGGNGGSAINWASNEGQADYFATTKCLRKAWINDNNQAVVRKMVVPQDVTQLCQKTYKYNKEDRALCVRTSMAGKSVAELFADLGKLPVPEFNTPDTKVVTKTDDNHPKAQCRLDTYFQGSVCDVSMNEDVSATDEVKGTCHPSLGHTVGTRPLCWFKPNSI